MYRYCKAELHIDLLAVAKGQERLRRCVSQHVRTSWMDQASSFLTVKLRPYLSIQNKKQTSADLSVMIGRDDNPFKKGYKFCSVVTIA